MGREEIAGEVCTIPETGFEDFGRIDPRLPVAFGEEDELREPAMIGAGAQEAGGLDIEAGLLEQLAAEGLSERLAVAGMAAREAPLLFFPETVLEKQDAALIIENDTGDAVDKLGVEQPCQDPADRRGKAIPDFCDEIKQQGWLSLPTQQCIRPAANDD